MSPRNGARPRAGFQYPRKLHRGLSLRRPSLAPASSPVSGSGPKPPAWFEVARGPSVWKPEVDTAILRGFNHVGEPGSCPDRSRSSNPMIGVARHAGGDSDPTDRHVTIEDLPAFLRAVFEAAATEAGKFNKSGHGARRAPACRRGNRESNKAANTGRPYSLEALRAARYFGASLLREGSPPGPSLAVGGAPGEPFGLSCAGLVQFIPVVEDS